MSLTYVTFLLLDFIYCHINLLRLFRLITQHCKKKLQKKTVIQVGGLASIKPKIKLLLFFLGGNAILGIWQLIPLFLTFDFVGFYGLALF